MIGKACTCWMKSDKSPMSAAKRKVQVVRPLRVEKDFFNRAKRVFLEHLGDNLVAVVLFGSRARGQGDTYSDYDLFVVARKLPLRRMERLILSERVWRESYKSGQI